VPTEFLKFSGKKRLILDERMFRFCRSRPLESLNPQKGANVAKKITSGKALSKSQVYSELADSSELSRKQVAAVFDGLTGVIRRELGKKGPGLFTVPGLMKVKVVRKKATKERMGVNPFTGEQQMFKAKPARNVVKVLPLKALKGMV